MAVEKTFFNRDNTEIRVYINVQSGIRACDPSTRTTYRCVSSLIVFDDGVELVVSIFFDFIHRHCVSKPLRFEGWLFPRLQVKPTLLGNSGFEKTQCRWIKSKK
jgi:hypothetical protein